MRILVIGSGGREHALAWKLAQEAEIHGAPGNPGMSQVGTCHAVTASDLEGMADLARRLAPDLIVIGPEAPLSAGMGDRLRAEDFPVFGPNADGARLESSKAFSKALMVEAGVPTAKSWTVSIPELAKEKARILLESGPAVIKADGLAAGKGVLICATEDEADAAIREMMTDRAFGDSGETVVVEEFIPGREFSLFSLTNGREFISLPIAQDYKRIFDSDKGPNTGGMGSYSPVEWVGSETVRQTEDRVVRPILEAMGRQGIDYRGVLFSGLMAKGNNIQCLEYNVRFGDPETQSLMVRLGQGFADALKACAKGEPIPPVEVLPLASVTVVLASAGYPGSITSGVPIQIDSEMTRDVQIFHAGTALKDGQLVTAGGRVLGVTSTATTLTEARAMAFEAVRGVHFDGMQFRKDVALA